MRRSRHRVFIDARCGGDSPQSGLAFDFNEVIKLVLADVLGGNSQRFQEARRSFRRNFGLQWEIEFDVVPATS